MENVIFGGQPPLLPNKYKNNVFFLNLDHYWGIFRKQNVICPLIKMSEACEIFQIHKYGVNNFLCPNQ